MRLHRLLTMSVSAVVIAACTSGGADQPPSGGADQPPSNEPVQQATLPQNLCDLVPKADAEKIMGKALVQHRGDDSGCEYRDARGTTGTGLMVFLNVLTVSDQCRLTSGSEPLTGVGDEACISLGQPTGIYSTVVFAGGGRTFEVIAPGEDRASERSTTVAKLILSELGS
jgi:hypothetical protein